MSFVTNAVAAATFALLSQAKTTEEWKQRSVY
jgi:hypothetical protein